MDPSQATITSINVTNQDTGCPAPRPFILNINSDEAFLNGNGFNGIQPEDAGNYTCHSNGLPRATVEIIVLGKTHLSTTFFKRVYGVIINFMVIFCSTSNL